MDNQAIQNYIVVRANKKFKDILKDYCIKQYKSEDYYKFIQESIDNGVIEVPNIQIWVEDDYVTNSTTFSLCDVADHPCTYSQQMINYAIPKSEKNFKEGDMARERGLIYYERYLAECVNVLHLLNSYYPTHTIEVHDFGLALFTLWSKATNSLLKGVQESYKEFFTHKLISQMLCSLVFNKNKHVPNFKFIVYDSVGTSTQTAQKKREAFKDRFNSNTPFFALCTHESYQGFMRDFIAPIRSLKAISKDFTLPRIEYREINKFTKAKYVVLQGFLHGSMLTLNPKTYDAFKQIMAGHPIEDTLQMLEQNIPPDAYKAIVDDINKYKRRKSDIEYKYQFEDRNITSMEKNGVVFTNYEYTTELLPPDRIFSETIINMDKFVEQYPSQTNQQFTEIYLAAQTINMCRRTFIKNNIKNGWALKTKVRTRDIKFNFEDALNELNTRLRSENMDNFIAVIK